MRKKDIVINPDFYRFDNDLFVEMIAAIVKLEPGQETTACDSVGAERYGALTDLERYKLECQLKIEVKWGSLKLLAFSHRDKDGLPVYKRVASD